MSLVKIDEQWCFVGEVQIGEVTYETMVGPEYRYVIDGVLPTGIVNLITSDDGNLNAVAASEVALAVDEGRGFRGTAPNPHHLSYCPGDEDCECPEWQELVLATHKGQVVYLAHNDAILEANTMLNALTGFRQGALIHMPLPVLWADTGRNSNVPSRTALLVAQIEANLEAHPSLVVIDDLAHAIGKQEWGIEEALSVLTDLGKLAQALDCAVLVTYTSSKEDSIYQRVTYDRLVASAFRVTREWEDGVPGLVLSFDVTPPGAYLEGCVKCAGALGGELRFQC